MRCKLVGGGRREGATVTAYLEENAGGDAVLDICIRTDGEDWTMQGVPRVFKL